MRTSFIRCAVAASFELVCRGAGKGAAEALFVAVLVATATGLATSARADEVMHFEVVKPGTECGCSAPQFGIRDDTTDGYDPGADRLVGDPNATRGHIAVYRENGADWSGPTGYYDRDRRGPLASDATYTWETLYLWAPQVFEGDQIDLIADGRFALGRTFTLELTAVPAGVTGAPDVGTSWTLPKDRSFKLSLPAYRTDDPTTGYQFRLTIGPFETSSVGCASAAPLLVVLLVGGLSLLTRRGKP